MSAPAHGQVSMIITSRFTSKNLSVDTHPTRKQGDVFMRTPTVREGIPLLTRGVRFVI